MPAPVCPVDPNSPCRLANRKHRTGPFEQSEAVTRHFDDDIGHGHAQLVRQSTLVDATVRRHEILSDETNENISICWISSLEQTLMSSEMMYLCAPFESIRVTILSTLSSSLPSLVQCSDGLGSAAMSSWIVAVFVPCFIVGLLRNEGARPSGNLTQPSNK